MQRATAKQAEAEREPYLQTLREVATENNSTTNIPSSD